MPAAAPRSLQLDGWRALSVLGVMWLHWAPRSWRGPLPFEIGLFFFLTLSGFLITRILLQDRDRGESTGSPWRLRSLHTFQARRVLRIVVPCYLAMAFAFLVRAPDILAHPWWYFTHLSNFHIALLPEYPAGTAHYWTLAIQQQFYLFWPFFVFFLPRRALAAFFTASILAAPLSRFLIDASFPQVHHPGAFTTCALDYFGAGGLLALMLHRGFDPRDHRLRTVAWIAFATYAVFYSLSEAGRLPKPLGYFQQSILAIAICGLIVSSLTGLRGPVGRFLESAPLHHIAKISYGLYLFHATVPMALGWILPVLWHLGDGPAALALRLVAFSLSSWAIAWLCWRYVEVPMARFKQRVTR